MMPVLPAAIPPSLEQLILDVTAGSAALGGGLHPLILEEIARFMLKVNSYYTNAMEGNPSRLKDIERALDQEFAKDKAARNFQLEHLAHIAVQEAMIKRLREEPQLKICSEAFLCWLHEQFYSRLPEDMRLARTLRDEFVAVVPGRLRDRGISVGGHDAPHGAAEIRAHLRSFEELLSPEVLSGPRRLLGMASSHHRFLWIHPFADGNGRVARLLTIAYGVRIGLGDDGLWTVTRAFARDRALYDAHLALADQPRRNDLDGRGPLSQENLVKFCAYFLERCKDQIDHMAELMKLEGLQGRFAATLQGRAAARQLSHAAAKVMARVLSRGEVPRADVPGICRVKQRRATQIIKETLDRGLARSPTPYGPLRLNLSVDLAGPLFPSLT